MNFLSIIPVLLLAITSWAADPVPEKWESYSVRPDVLSLRPQSHPELGETWKKLRRAHLDAVAQILELYPVEELYFLARDAELFYDAARLIVNRETQGDAKALGRLHLLNVSRANMYSRSLKDYLAQEGLSLPALGQGKRAVFIDTGFSGTIPRVIAQTLPETVRSRLRSHLLVSSSPDVPSTRVFLVHLNPVAPRMYPGAMHATIVNYESLPRATGRSTEFRQLSGRWEPMSEVGSARSLDGEVDPQKARAYMEDLAHALSVPKVIDELRERRLQWRKLVGLARSGEQVSLRAELQALVDAGDPMSEAMVRDFVEVMEKNSPSPLSFPLFVEQFGLVRPSLSSSSNKKHLIKAYPEWKSVLEDPETGIKTLMKRDDFITLGAISDALQDAEFSVLLAKQLAKQDNPSLVARNFLRAVIDKGESMTLEALGHYFFSSSNSAKWGDEVVMDFIEKKAGTFSLSLLALNGLSKPFSLGWGEQVLIKFIEHADSFSMQTLATHAFSRPHASKWSQKVVLKFIEKADDMALTDFAIFALSKIHGLGWGEEPLVRFVEKASQVTLESFEDYVMIRPHFKGPEWQPYRDALKIKSPSKRGKFLRQALGARDSRMLGPLCKDRFRDLGI